LAAGADPLESRAQLLKAYSRFSQPLSRRFDFARVEVADLGHRERLAHLGHPSLPRLLADQRDAVDLGAVGGRKLDVVPQCVQVPALEIVELGQDPDLAVLRNGVVDRRDEVLVILVVQLSGELEAHGVFGEPGQLLDHGCASLGWTVEGVGVLGLITPSYRLPSVNHGFPSPLRPSRTLWNPWMTMTSARSPVFSRSLKRRSRSASTSGAVTCVNWPVVWLRPTRVSKMEAPIQMGLSSGLHLSVSQKRT